MAEPVVNSKLVIPTVPSLSHLALVKIAVPFFYKYGSDMLNTAMTDIQYKNLTVFNEGIRLNPEENRAKEALLYIPAHLRKRVLEAVNGTEVEMYRWLRDHYFFSITHLVKNNLFWRSDGTIDRIKTAQDLVLNENITISTRFRIACKYCFKPSIMTLWEEIVACGKAKNYATSMGNNSIESFWINWIRDGIPANWPQALLEQSVPATCPRYSSFFPLLEHEDRKRCLEFIHRFDLDDMRFCLYAMTSEEEVEIVKMDVKKFLMIFCKWPHQNLFLEMVEKVKNYIDYESFKFLLYFIMDTRFCADFDYRKLLEGVLNMSYKNFKLKLRDLPLIDTIKQCLKKKRYPQIEYVGPRKELFRYYHP